MAASCWGPNCCLRKDSRTEMMIPVSIVSRKTMKKIGTANTLGMVTAKPSIVWAKVGLVWRGCSPYCSRSSRLCEVRKYPELDKSGISDSDLIRWVDIDLIKLRTLADVGT